MNGRGNPSPTIRRLKVYIVTKVSDIVGTDVLGCVEYLLFSGEEKRSKKVAGTLATVSRTPQRSLGK